ncbi:MAG TPA: HAMP domain-containing sensor histidine kinase [Thermoanaerobaculia bacterium]
MRDGTRTTFIVALLIATFVLTAFMAVRAQMAATYHRTTAEKVIRDWTRVAADELARRVDAQATFYGTYPILQRMLAGEPSSGDLVASTDVPPQVAAIAADPPPPEKRVPVHAGGRTYVYATGNGRIVAFEVNRAAIAPFFQRVLDARPLMPPSLAEGRVTNDAVRFRVTDGARTIFATRAPAYRETSALPAVRHTVEEGLLRGMVVEASIDSRIAPLLVFGGIPRPLPVYAVTLVLAGALLFVALVQLRKERALARLRADFVASVSHELRTPLTQIRMFAETLLLDRVRSDEERQRSLRVIDQETRRLAQLVEKVLQFSRGERGTLRISRDRTDLGALVAETVDLFRPIAAARGVTIATAVAPGVRIEIDRDALRQIVLNLLDNAVKYGPEGQEVRVIVQGTGGRAQGAGEGASSPAPRALSPAPSAARIVVDDAGPGIPPRERKRIWRRYERLARERDRAVAGAGIGLALVRELVRLHGGSARVEESARGGAAFIVELPA